MAAAAEERGALEHALRALESLLDADPLVEVEQQRLMRVLTASGRRSDAAKAYERFAELLRDSLGLEPTPETRALLDAVRGVGPRADATPPPTQDPR